MPRRQTRPWRHSGIHRSLPTPAQETAAASLRDRLLADRGGPEHATEAETVLIELIAMGAIMHNDAARYLGSLPRPWVDRRSNKSIRLVHDVRRLAAHVAKLLAHLGYDRRAIPVEDLRSYVARQQASGTATDPAPSRHGSRTTRRLAQVRRRAARGSHDVGKDRGGWPSGGRRVSRPPLRPPVRGNVARNGCSNQRATVAGTLT